MGIAAAVTASYRRVGVLENSTEHHYTLVAVVVYRLVLAVDVV